MAPNHYWLLKAEPDSRIVKGKDVKFSVDDFEIAQTTSWEGVRNAEARNLMKEMSLGDKVLFYHSNCKSPGIAALAEVTKEAYPDYSAWDPDHPYYDQKTDKEKPKWYMVDVTFRARLAYFIPLSLLKKIAGSSTDTPDEDVEYIGSDGVKSIKHMALVTRGRLSVQRVDEATYDVLVQMGERGGWSDTRSKGSGSAKPARKSGAKKLKEAKYGEQARDDSDGDEKTEKATRAGDKKQPSKHERKRKAAEIVEQVAGDSRTLRRSTRARR